MASEMPTDIDEEMSRIFEEFRTSWSVGEPRCIEDYLDGFSDQAQTRIFDALLDLELECRIRFGDPPLREDYLSRFADRREQVESIFLSRFGTNQFELESDASTSRMLEYDVPPSEGTAKHPDHEGESQTGDQSPRPVTNLPPQIGPFTPSKLLGRGNFSVYLAFDGRRGTEVAVKVGRKDDPEIRRRLMSLEREAQKLATLDHPLIIKLLEFIPSSESPGAEASGRDHDGIIVLEYVPGPTLQELLDREFPEPRRLAEIVAGVADAVNHAHLAGLVHRDLKPSNILMDEDGRPHVCDFGLAIDEEVCRLRQGEVVGTLSFMAPEQVRGETNRLDGRTDIWAMGIILYRGLTGRLPFRGDNRGAIIHEILSHDPRPPRQFDDRIPRELERICLRCLARPMNERYLTAADLAQDLQEWLAQSAASGSEAPAEPVSVVPRGLHAFGGEDAAFFLSLVPGPRRGDGLPELIRSWKDGIEATIGERAFPVGLLCGPSGSGKSSFVKAGLIPLLDPRKFGVARVESTPTGTEANLLAELRRLAPALPGDIDLPDSIALLRGQPGYRPRAKVLLVIDQLEQWLQANRPDADAPLVRALRQCDGRNVQALLLVRDDFWMAVSRLFHALEVPLLQGKNTMMLEPFDEAHARGVLVKLGRSLGRVPLDGEPPTDVRAFLDEASRGLTARAGLVNPMRLSLLFEVIRNRPWIPKTLRELGGVDGIGVKFLEQCFESPAAPAAYRHHRTAAQAILQAILPAPTSDIRGTPRASSELLRASGYAAESPDRFLDLMRILDEELRIVVATEPERASDTARVDDDRGREAHYQFAHDYLIRPVRQWLEREQNSTSRGRARLRLRLIAAAWAEKPGRRMLPTILECLSIVRHTRYVDWSPDERRMMRMTGKHYLGRGLAIILLILCSGLVAKNLLDRDRARESLDRALQAFQANDRDLPRRIQELDPYRALVLKELEAREHDARLKDREVTTLLLYRMEPNSERGEYLAERLVDSEDPERVDLFCQALSTHPGHVAVDRLRGQLENNSLEPARRLRAACALAALAPGAAEKSAQPGVLSLALIMEQPRTFLRWLDLLRGLEPRLIQPLAETARDPDVDARARSNAAGILAEALIRSGDAEMLARSIVAAHHTESADILTQALVRLGARQPAIEYLRSVLDERGKEGATEVDKDELAGRQAMASLLLAALGLPDRMWEMLRHHPDPRRRSLLIQKLAGTQASRTKLLTRLERADLDPIERQAILLAWAETRKSSIPGAQAASVLKRASVLFSTDPHPGVHSSAELLLRRWGAADEIVRAEDQIRRDGRKPAGQRWELGPNGHTFAIAEQPLRFRMGSPLSEEDRFEHENPHDRLIARSLAVAMKELSIAQYRRFKPEYPWQHRYIRDQDCPLNLPTWFDAAAYCNWLSRQAGIDPSQWCYPASVVPGMTIAVDSVDRIGYRLPTEAEWEYLCRAGTTTSRYYGETAELLPRHAWTWLSSDDKTSPVGLLLPNELGLFDMLGNVFEWCHDGPPRAVRDHYPPYQTPTALVPLLDRPRAETVDERTYRFLRGSAFDYSPYQARSAHRYRMMSSHLEGTIGFRVVRTLPTAGRK